MSYESGKRRRYDPSTSYGSSDNKKQRLLKAIQEYENRLVQLKQEASSTRPITESNSVNPQNSKSSFPQGKVGDLELKRKISSLQQMRHDCIYYNRHGFCKRLSGCKYDHIPANVNLCPSILGGKPCDLVSYADLPHRKSGKTLNPPDGNNFCPWSHTPTAFKVPLCFKFQTGTCPLTPMFASNRLSSDSNLPLGAKVCSFVHLKKSSNALICFAFSKGFYCTRGPFSCDGKHISPHLSNYLSSSTSEVSVSEQTSESSDEEFVPL